MVDLSKDGNKEMSRSKTKESYVCHYAAEKPKIRDLKGAKVEPVLQAGPNGWCCKQLQSYRFFCNLVCNCDQCPEQCS